MTKKVQYYPKGGMCSVCDNKWQDCSQLDFENMPIHRQDDFGYCVICTNFTKEPKQLINEYEDGR